MTADCPAWCRGHFTPPEAGYLGVHRATLGSVEGPDGRTVALVSVSEIMTDEGSWGASVAFALDLAGVDQWTPPAGFDEAQARALGQALLAAADIARDHPRTLPPADLGRLRVVRS